MGLAFAVPLVASAQEWQVIAQGPILVKVRPRGTAGLRDLWAEGEMDAEVQDLQSAILDEEAYPRFMPYVKEVRTLEITPEGERLVYTRVEPPFIGARDYVVKMRVRKVVGPDGSGEFANAWHSVPDRFPRRQAVIRLAICDGSWEISQAPSGRARVVYRAAVDPGGWLPGFLSNLANSAGTMDAFRAVEREARRRGEVRRAQAASTGPPGAPWTPPGSNSGPAGQ